MGTFQSGPQKKLLPKLPQVNIEFVAQNVFSAHFESFLDGFTGESMFRITLYCWHIDRQAMTRETHIVSIIDDIIHWDRRKTTFHKIVIEWTHQELLMDDINKLEKFANSTKWWKHIEVHGFD